MIPSLRWALYLGISWTWCIGMFLPVILTRDFGRWSFLVFALPNIIGAAAMGWVIPDAAASRRLVNKHTRAMVAFSLVTIAYQAFFAGWMLPQLIGWWTTLFYPLIVTVIILAVRRDREFSWISLITWLISLSLGTLLAAKGHLSLPPLGDSRQFLGTALITPVCLFGFLFSPYLDVTFHHALQRAYETGGRSAKRTAFTLGFAVVFGLMILFTFFYANLLRDPASAPLARKLIGFHMLIQMCVTIVMHFVQAGVASQNPKGIKAGGYMILGAFAVGIFFWFLAWITTPIDTAAAPVPATWQAGEYLYRTFLAAYGLAFPAYVLTQLLPSKPIAPKTLAILCLAALPLYALGFFTLHPEFIALGVLLIVATSILTLRAASGRRASDF